MNNWIPKSQIIRFAIFSAIFSVILYFGSLFVVLGNIREIEDSYKNTESKSSKEERILAIKSISESNAGYIQVLRNFLIQKGDEVKFIEQIENIGEKSGIQFEINSIEIKTKQEDVFKEDVALKMTIKGSWQNIMVFINMLEKMPFGVSIENIKLDSDVPTEWSGLLEFIVFREK